MRTQWARVWKLCVALSTGGITIGILQGLGLVNFASLFTNFLITWLSVLVTLLLGGDPSSLLSRFNA